MHTLAQENRKSVTILVMCAREYMRMARMWEKQANTHSTYSQHWLTCKQHEAKRWLEAIDYLLQADNMRQARLRLTDLHDHM